MAGIDLAIAQSNLEHWLAIDAASGVVKSGSGSGRSATYHDPEQIRRQLDYWNRKVIELSRGSRIAATRVVIHD